MGTDDLDPSYEEKERPQGSEEGSLCLFLVAVTSPSLTVVPRPRQTCS